MKRLFTLLLLGGSLTGWAQQVNGTFDEPWEKCFPYNSCDGKEQGTEPVGWQCSNTRGVKLMSTIGYASFTFQVTGREGQGYAVKLKNGETGALSFKSNVPAYICLGTPWATSVGTNKSDGGAFGGIDFTYRPDAIEFYYQRTATASSTQPATVVAYLWNGTYVQKDVPQSLVISKTPATSDMTNRDRNILGKTLDGCQGGTVTQEGTLVASLEHSITTNTASGEWDYACIPFTYTSNTKPEKINIIFAANDYFGARTAIVKDDQLIVDDVRLVYYNTLKSLSYEGASIDFKENTLSYDLSQFKYEATKLSFEKKAVGGTAQATYDEASGIVTLKVTGEDGNSTIYSLQFKKVTGEISSISYNGTPIEGFTQGTNHYYAVTGEYTEGCLTATPQDEGANVQCYYDATTRIATISIPESGMDIKYYVKFAEKATGYNSKLVIGMAGGFLSAPTQEVGITSEKESKVDLQLTNFSLEGLGHIGDIYVYDVAISPDGSISKTDNITIFGEMGAMLGILPLELTGKLSNGELSATLNITWEGMAITVNVYPLSTTSVDLKAMVLSDFATSISQIKQDLTNPNCIIYTADGTVATGLENVVTGTACETLNLGKDGNISISNGFNATNVNINRTFASGWHTICVPFETTPEALGAAQAQAFTGFDGKILTFGKVTAMSANTPYLVLFENEKALIKLQNIAISATVPTSVTHGNVTFVGNYEAGKNMEGLYGVAEKAGEQYIMRGGAGSTLGSTGAYFTVSGSEANSLRIRLEGTGTGISDVEAGKGGQTFDVYSLNGIKVRSQATTTEGLPKGIYLINGKKHIVK